MRTDIFELEPFGEEEEPNPKLDSVWWTGLLIIAAQLGIAVVPWVRFVNWGVMLILLSGTMLALITSSLPQRRQDKWSGARLDRHSVNILTRGSGHRHIMVFVGSKGSYNLETMATAQARARLETPVMAVISATLWAGLLICTSGLKQDSWFLVSIGGLGMLQNIYAAGRARSQDTTGLKITKSPRK